MNSILNSIKKLVGMDEEETDFDGDIILHINSAFAILNQLGVGPTTIFAIFDKDATWDDFIDDDTININHIKTYIGLKVKLWFDPPTNSSVIKAMEEQIRELEWRLNVSPSIKEEEE